MIDTDSVAEVNSTAQLQPFPEMSAEKLEFLDAWVRTSDFLFWFVLAFSLLTLPLLLHALFVMLRHRSSHYFCYLTAMLTADILMLVELTFRLITDFIPGLRAWMNALGPTMCKVTATTANVTACFVNWAWVMMFLQRFIYVFYPMEKVRSAGGCFDLISNAKFSLTATFVVSIITQIWSPFIMTEVVMRNQYGNYEATFCAHDEELVDAEVFKWITIADAIWTYALPLAVTIFSDLAVLIGFQRISRSSKTQFTIVNREEIHRPLCTLSSTNLTSSGRKPSVINYGGMKIQSKKSIMSGNSRRHRAIRRCLIMATLQLLLTVPNYAVQLADGIFHLQDNNTTAVLYLYVDAFCYILYLFQFPLLAAYVYCFIKIQRKDIIIRTVPRILSICEYLFHSTIGKISWFFRQ